MAPQANHYAQQTRMKIQHRMAVSDDQCPDIFDVRSDSFGKNGNIVPWQECGPGLPGDGHGEGGEGNCNVSEELEL